MFALERAVFNYIMVLIFISDLFEEERFPGKITLLLSTTEII
jgi:hypothetical protein